MQFRRELKEENHIVECERIESNRIVVELKERRRCRFRRRRCIFGLVGVY